MGRRETGAVTPRASAPWVAIPREEEKKKTRAAGMGLRAMSQGTTSQGRATIGKVASAQSRRMRLRE